ncbi:sensor histidine kinase [Vagococcus xieshaowenii]|uniref:histidine kinase n=1 Tax=Vagococcus xieshaowenii TaxID=2562451 RepID=A0A4Z0D3I4_9ENTE|nr:HAMP domain-containing sensor histidine kinase [Vagococcus xieshaowenii]QCA28084.1 HAMP domain-containing histidine kinase [Vagococcus xieshaowenii]TFZ40127.1 HAMP domain-containing histidine kinase [Vagococcus xieshaowenii]
MKYLLQQMLGFFIVILTVMIVVGISFKSLTRQTLVENYYDQMFSYARSVVTLTKNRDGKLIDNIKDADDFLKNQKVGIILFNQNKEVVYPEKIENAEILAHSLTEEELSELKNGQAISFSKKYRIHEQEKDFAVIVQPIFTEEIDNSFAGALVMYHSVSLIDANINALTKNLLMAFLLSSLLAIVFSFIFSQYQVNRINRIKNGTKKIANGELDVQIDVTFHKKFDELDELAISFNKMAKKLHESNLEIEHQEEQRRRFMADAAHEMRTPLTTINGLLEGVSHNMIPESQKEKTVELLRKETNRLIRLVNENLDFEKIRTNQIQMAFSRFNAAEVLNGIMTQLSQKASEFGNTIYLESDEIIPIDADYDRFIQIIFNITQNAIQFTQNGQITIKAVRKNSQTMIEIQDTGIGMTDEEVRNIWERYYKVDPSRKHTKYGESGLGLAIVQQLIRLHDGTVEVKSQKGEGTTFMLIFPDHLDKKE